MRKLEEIFYVIGYFLSFFLGLFFIYGAFIINDGWGFTTKGGLFVNSWIFLILGTIFSIHGARNIIRLLKK